MPSPELRCPATTMCGLHPRLPPEDLAMCTWPCALQRTHGHTDSTFLRNDLAGECPFIAATASLCPSVLSLCIVPVLCPSALFLLFVSLGTPLQLS